MQCRRDLSASRWPPQQSKFPTDGIVIYSYSIQHSSTSNNQRVLSQISSKSHEIPISLGENHDFAKGKPMVFLGISHGFPGKIAVFPWFRAQRLGMVELLEVQRVSRACAPEAKMLRY